MNNNTKARKILAGKAVMANKADGLVSCNKARNMAQRVYHNKGDNGTMSLTVHEPWLKHEPVCNKNHGYIEYRPHRS